MRSTWRGRIGGWLALAGAAASPLPAAPPAPPAPPAVQSWPVDRQTTGWLVADPRAPLVTLHLEFPVGAWSSWCRTAEADHAFAMQLHDPAGRLRREADRLGLDPIVRVGRRAAILRVTCLRSDLDETLAWVRAVLDNREIDRAEVRQRGREHRLDFRFAMQTARFRARREHARLLFARGDPRSLPYAPPRKPHRDAVELVRARDRVIGLPGRLVAFAGDLDLAAAERAAAGLLPPANGEAIPDGSSELSETRAPRAGDDDVDVAIDRLTQVYFSYGRESLPLDDPDYPAFLVADHVLGGHFYSRLYRALRHEGGETYAAFSSNDGDVATDLYALITFTRTENAATTERKLREALERFHAAGITREEAQDAIGFLRGRLDFARQSPRQILDRRLRERRWRLAPGFLDAQVERAARLGLEEINAFIARFYDPARFVMVRVGPPE